MHIESIGTSRRGDKMDPLLSVIIPVYNAEQRIEACLTSLMQQTYDEIEFILIDDGSTDRSCEIMKEFVQRDRRMQLIEQTNAGVSAARNAGINAAKGEYVGFVDADDWIEPRMYESLMKSAVSSNSDIVVCGYYVDYPGNRVAGASLEEFHAELDSLDGLATVLATRNRFVWTRIFRRSILDSVRFREDIHWGEDTLFVVEAAMGAARTTVVHMPLYHYVQTPSSATRSATNPKRITGPKMTEIMERMIEAEYPSLVDYVIETRLNIIGILIQDAFESDDEVSSAIIDSSRRHIQRDLPRLLTARRLSFASKFKAILICLSPRLFVAVRNRQVARR